MANEFSDVVPYVTLLMGWGLNEAHQLLATRQKQNASINKALTYLLEIRFQLNSIEKLVSYMKNKWPEASEIAPNIREVMDVILGSGDDLNEKYQSAVDVIAETDPFLAYRLASRNKISQFFNMWRNFASSMGWQGSRLEEAEAALKELIGPAFDELIEAVAEGISCAAKRKVRKILSQGNDVPIELEQYFVRFMDEDSRVEA